MTRANVFFRAYFKVFLGARAFLMSYKSTYLGKILRAGRRQFRVTNSGGAANAKVTQGCGYSHWVLLQWASCISTAWDYDRAGTERRKTWIHPVALWFSQVFWHWYVFQILKEPWWRPAILVEKKKRDRILFSIAVLNCVESSHHSQLLLVSIYRLHEIYKKVHKFSL